MDSLAARLRNSLPGAAASGKARDPAILSASALGFPFECESPFLFAVYHLDRYPKGNDKLGPAASLKGHSIGADFGNPAGWSMYHGETVPGFPKHPHRGFETITITRQGWIDHTDSLGNAGRFGEGDVQWMTAGNGINHSEMFPLLDSERENMLELFQVWINLPRKSKMVDPSYKMLWSEDIPQKVFSTADEQAEVTLIHGSLPNLGEPPAPPPNSYASDIASDVLVATVKLAPNSSWTLPGYSCLRSLDGLHRNLYFYAGDSVKISGREFTAHRKVKLRPDADVEIIAGSGGAEILVLQGRDIGEPVVSHGPFVMSSKDEIRQAFQDYQRTGFGGWPWKSDALVHDRSRQRFAQYPDGKVEERSRRLALS